ncbi:TniQ family protein [Streptomyces sp. KR55]|uniref:TniQ family protein n=1 Tax=Streptomyces sp. KR55 TaxID=3457425 RepID=UPI003FD5CD1C
MSLGPVHGETLGSYLHRLAIVNNRPAVALAELIGPLPPEFSPLSNTTARWTARSPQALAALTGRPPERLAKALPALADFLKLAPGSRPTHVIGRRCRSCMARRSPDTPLVITLNPVHRYACSRHRTWTRSTHDLPLMRLPEVLPAQRRLDRLARRYPPLSMTKALETARKVVDEWARQGIPINVGDEWTRRLSHITAEPTSRAVPASDQRRLAAFPETVVLAELVLNPPAHNMTPKDLYLTTAAELSRRLSRIYTTLGIQDPLFQRLHDLRTGLRDTTS